MKDEDEKIEANQDQDDVVEFVFNDDGEEDLKATLKKFRADLKACRKEKEEYLAQLQRERADFINYKKEEDSRFKRSIEYNQERFISDLLPVLDSYDMAFSNKEAWEKVDKNWRMGVEYIHQQILKVLAEYGVTPIEVNLGDAFDHNIHEPIENTETADTSKSNTISEITQSGYKVGDRVLRPARVKVYKST